MPGTTSYKVPLGRRGGRVKGKVYESDLNRKGKQSEAMPDCLIRFKRAGLLDKEFERAPLPDVERPCDLDYIWASDINVDCGRRVKPHRPLDQLDFAIDTTYVATKEDKGD